MNTFKDIQEYLERNQNQEESKKFVTPQKKRGEDIPLSSEGNNLAVKNSTPGSVDQALVGSNFKEENPVDKKIDEVQEEIKKAQGFNELDEEEKIFCIENQLLPMSYQTFKKKIQNKAKNSKNAIRRVAALEFLDKQIGKIKALAIFDFLAERKKLSGEPIPPN